MPTRNVLLGVEVKFKGKQVAIREKRRAAEFEKQLPELLKLAPTKSKR
jgi:hypothetical protein